MTYPQASIWLDHGWTIGRIEWNNPDFYLRKCELNGRMVARASHPNLRITVDDLNADDWVQLAQGH